MFSHVMFGADDVSKAKTFYDATLGALGYKPGHIDDRGRCFYVTPTGVFGITQPINGQAATHANGGTVGFMAANEAAVDAWHQAGLANGGTECEDPPGLRAGGFGNLYVAYLRDPYGNKVCAMHRSGSNPS
ncbi:VOC family protein [Ketobacter sp.]|uniref:VOC family protein n=1 Tax=Ketobacter sp. TaxID=2083498 RepID=UPI000F169621|nr:VOC family protein [Ketobacter sp.]RLT96960.1 MAG: VOC family protein [Ketobacter sp.]